MPIDMGSVSALISSLNSAANLTKIMIGLHQAAAVRDNIIELQGVILAAQNAALSSNIDQFALLERVRELEKEIASMKAWDTEKQKYELAEVSPGAFAYINKPGVDSTEPDHWLCAACYQHSRKSLIQNRGTAPPPSQRCDIFYCPECKAEMRVSWNELGLRHWCMKKKTSPKSPFESTV